MIILDDNQTKQKIDCGSTLNPKLQDANVLFSFRGPHVEQQSRMFKLSNMLRGISMLKLNNLFTLSNKIEQHVRVVLNKMFKLNNMTKLCNMFKMGVMLKLSKIFIVALYTCQCVQ